jgi:hypothetical protein
MKKQEIKAQIQEIVNRETRAWDTQDIDLWFFTQMSAKEMALVDPPYNDKDSKCSSLKI